MRLSGKVFGAVGAAAFTAAFALPAFAQPAPVARPEPPAAIAQADTEEPENSGATAPMEEGEPAFTVAVLTGLNKITARTYTIKAPVDEVTTFGTLEITVRACRKAPPTEPPKTTAFLEVREPSAATPGEDGELQGDQPIFMGWMIASSPGLHALEHPVYDVWVVDCSTS